MPWIFQSTVLCIPARPIPNCSAPPRCMHATLRKSRCLRTFHQLLGFFEGPLEIGIPQSRSMSFLPHPIAGLSSRVFLSMRDSQHAEVFHHGFHDDEHVGVDVRSSGNDSHAFDAPLSLHSSIHSMRPVEPPGSLERAAHIFRRFRLSLEWFLPDRFSDRIFTHGPERVVRFDFTNSFDALQRILKSPIRISVRALFRCVSASSSGSFFATFNALVGWFVRT